MTFTNRLSYAYGQCNKYTCRMEYLCNIRMYGRTSVISDSFPIGNFFVFVVFSFTICPFGNDLVELVAQHHMFLQKNMIKLKCLQIYIYIYIYSRLHINNKNIEKRLLITKISLNVPLKSILNPDCNLVTGRRKLIFLAACL